MSDFAIRKLIEEDIAAVLALDRSLATAPHWRRDDYEAYVVRRDCSPRRIALVIERNGLLIGFAVAIIISAVAELESICVAAGNQRQGAGARLLRALLKELHAAGANQVFLEVRPSNHAAIALYRRFNFIEVGRRPGYYSSPAEDAICMKCGL